MKRTMSTLTVVVVLATLLALPAGATHEDPCLSDDITPELVLVEQETFIKEADTKVGNLAALDVHDFPTWSTEAPTTSVQGGAGGGYLATAPARLANGDKDPTGSATFAGIFEGCLDTIAVELYLISPESNAFGALTIRPNLVIDGIPVYEHFDGGGIDVATQVNEGGDATHVMRFAFTGIHEALSDGVTAPQNGTHEVQLTVASQFADLGHVVYVYDTTEVPSGLHFNGPTSDSTVIEQNWS